MAKIPFGYERLEGSQRVARGGARLAGRADGDEKLSVTIRVRRRPDAAALPDMEYWVKTPPGQRTFLSREEFATLYGAAQADLDRVAEFSRGHGLSVTEMSVGQRLVMVSGTGAQVSRAFAVELGRYESPTESYRGYEGFIHVPTDLAGLIEGVFGLDNRKMARHSSNGGPYGANPLKPPQVAQLYNFPPGNQSGAAKQTIGVLEFGGGIDVNDVYAFCAHLGLPKPSVYPVPVDGAPTSLQGTSMNPVNADIEVALDTEVVASVALGVNIAVYFGPPTEQGWVDVVKQAISGEGLPQGWSAPSVLTCSSGWPENVMFKPFEWTQQAVSDVSESFQEAATQGVTTFVASGDWGSDANVGDGLAHVQYPSSDPWVTACGGTEITGTSPLQEETWNDEGDSDPGATGGGISEMIPVPHGKWELFPIP
jgi:kumamolisin